MQPENESEPCFERMIKISIMTNSASAKGLLFIITITYKAYYLCIHFGVLLLYYCDCEDEVSLPESTFLLA